MEDRSSWTHDEPHGGVSLGVMAFEEEEEEWEEEEWEEDDDWDDDDDDDDDWDDDDDDETPANIVKRIFARTAVRS